MALFEKGNIPWNKGMVGYKAGHKPYIRAFGKDNPFYGKKHSIETKEKMRLAKLGKKRGPMSQETKDKISKANMGKSNPLIRGKNHPNWKGGVTSRNRFLRASLRWKRWRTKVFDRDNYTCQNINCDYCNNVKGGFIHPHHIIPVSECLDLNYEEMIFDRNNGISYCPEYHKTLHSKRID